MKLSSNYRTHEAENQNNDDACFPYPQVIRSTLLREWKALAKVKQLLAFFVLSLLTVETFFSGRFATIQAMKIHISENTKALLDEDSGFQIEKRGIIEIKV
jgi:hypothetical protein